MCFSLYPATNIGQDRLSNGHAGKDCIATIKMRSLCYIDDDIDSPHASHACNLSGRAGARAAPHALRRDIDASLWGGR
jgi:hypothetical protein